MSGLGSTAASRPLAARARESLPHLARLSPADKLTVARLVALLVLVEIALRFTSLPRLGQWLGVPLRATPTNAPEGIVSHDPGAPLADGERRQAHLLCQIARSWPVRPGACLRHALVLGHILRRSDPVLRLGVARAGEEIIAHAWIEIRGASLEHDARFVPLELSS